MKLVRFSYLILGLLLIQGHVSFSFNLNNNTALLPQVIIFSSISQKTYGDLPFTLDATSDSDLTVTFSSSDPNVVTILDNVVTIISAGTVTITASQDGDDIYDPAPLVDHIITINKATVIATADNKERIYGEANPDFTISYTGFINSETISMVDAPPEALTLATTTSGVGNYPITVTGGVDSNYDFAYVAGELVINKSILTATADNKTRIYGDENPIFTVTLTGFKNSDNSSFIDAIPDAQSNETTTSDVGTYSISVSDGVDSNYDFLFVDGELTITQAAIIVAADNMNRVYGDPNPPFTITYTGLKNSETASEIDITPDLTSDANQTSGVGSYPILVTGGEDDNYYFSSYVDGTLTIAKATLEVSTANMEKIYSENNPDFSMTIIGFKNNETSSVIDMLPVATSNATQLSNTGIYPIVGSGGLDNNYDFSYIPGQFTITKAILTATIGDANRNYGDANPLFTITYEGFKNNETSSVIDMLPVATSNATQLSNARIYPIVGSGGLDDNYDFSYIDGQLTIVKATITATVGDANRSYGDANPLFTITYEGFKNNESLSVINILPEATSIATQSSDAGTYPIIVSGGVADNYDFLYVDGTLTIDKSSQIISFTALSDVVESTQTFNLLATSTAGLAVKFSSSNVDKISINGNVVTILNPGTITITATQVGDANYLAAANESQTICVLPDKPTITGSNLTTENAMLISSSDIGNEWYRDGILLNNGIAATYSIDASGAYTVQVTIDGCISELSQSFDVLVTQLEGGNSSAGIELFPNPAIEHVNLKLADVNDDEVSVITIYESNGRIVNQERITGKQNTIDIQQLQSGIYLMRVFNSDGLTTIRFIKE